MKILALPWASRDVPPSEKFQTISIGEKNMLAQYFLSPSIYCASNSRNLISIKNKCNEVSL